MPDMRMKIEFAELPFWQNVQSVLNVFNNAFCP